MPDDEPEERDAGQRDRPCGQPASPRRDKHDCACRKRREARVTQLLVAARERHMRRAPGGETCAILVRRRVAHRADYPASERRNSRVSWFLVTMAWLRKPTSGAMP